MADTERGAMAWRKIVDRPSEKVYEHASGLVRVHRHRKTTGRTVREGRWAVGRTSSTTSWSAITVHRLLLVETGTVTTDEAERLLPDEWTNVRSNLADVGIPHLSLKEAELFAERILDGSQKLVAFQIDYGPPSNGSEVLVGTPDAFVRR